MAQKERFCPNCGSRDVEPDTRHTNVLGDMMFNQDKWLCNECGYTGLMPVGDPEDTEFEPEEQKSIDTDTGVGYARLFAWISIPVILFLLYLVLRHTFF